MKPVLPYIILACLLTTACSSLPRLVPSTPAEKAPGRCLTPFPSKNQQLVHTLSAELPDGKHSLLTGVITVYPARNSIHAALLTQEGLVLFEGRVNGDQIAIKQAIPPFSDKRFAAALLGDVRLIFLKPHGSLMAIGKTERCGFVCRYKNKDGSFIDVKVDSKSSWELIQYDPGMRVARRVTAFSTDKPDKAAGRPAPSRLKLSAEGGFGYSLDMKLVRQVWF